MFRFVSRVKLAGLTIGAMYVSFSVLPAMGVELRKP
jgi:hypothetical protein